MCVGGYSSLFLVYIWPEDEFLCKVVHTLVEYCVAIEQLFVFSINIILIYKVSSSFRLSQRKNFLAKRISGLSRKYFEVGFVALHLVIPAMALSMFLVIEREPGLCFVTIRHSVDCFFGKGFVEKEYLTFEVVPLLVDSLLSGVCVCVLLVWLCWLRSRLFLKARIKTVIKEIGAWVGFLVGYCVVGILVESAHLSTNAVIKYTAFLSFPLFQSCIPIAFFVYMCVSLCPSRKKKSKVDGRNKRSTVQTAGLVTTPPSTRVSLPTDTAAHAPNFLSPIEEEFTEASPLLS